MHWWNNLISLGLLCSCLLNGVYTFRCKNQYTSGEMDIKVGLPALYEPSEDIYYDGATVRFHCHVGFHFPDWSNKFFWVKCSKRRGWIDKWPICRGPAENITCKNQYKIAPRSWQIPTPNQLRPFYWSDKNEYPVWSAVNFECPQDMHFKGALNLYRVKSYCMKDGQWSREWPMCKGASCDKFEVTNGLVDIPNIKIVPGTEALISCLPGFFLWGQRLSVCMNSLSWSGDPECVTLEIYKLKCKKLRGTFGMDSSSYPQCELFKGKKRKVHVSTKVAIPLGMCILVMLTVTMLSMHRLRRSQRAHATASDEQNGEEQTLRMVLPSYEDSVKDKLSLPPPTYMETFPLNETDIGTNSMSHSLPSSPPRYEEAC